MVLPAHEHGGIAHVLKNKSVVYRAKEAVSTRDRDGVPLGVPGLPCGRESIVPRLVFILDRHALAFPSALNQHRAPIAIWLKTQLAFVGVKSQAGIGLLRHYSRAAQTQNRKYRHQHTAH